MKPSVDKLGSGAGVHGLRQPPTLVIETLKRTALDHLGAIARGLYVPIEQALQEMELEAPGSRLADQQALATLCQREAALVMRYRQLLADNFDEVLASRSGTRRTPLSLLAEDQLQTQLDGQRLAATLATRHAEALAPVESRFSSLCHLLGQGYMKCPASPQPLSVLLIKTLEGQVLPPVLRSLLFKQYESELTRVLEPLYQQLDTQLGSAGYALHRPTAKIIHAAPVAVGQGLPGGSSQGLNASPIPAVMSRAVLPHATAVAADQLPTHGGDGRVVSEVLVHELEMLREQLQARRQGPGSSATAGGMERRFLYTDELQSVASILQGERSNVFAKALAHGGGRLQATLRNELIEGARRLGLDPEKTALSAGEEDAIDLVSLLFEAICDVHRLWETGRSLMSRLVLPYLKLALNDDNLFIQSSHPARRLLDALSEAFESNQGTTVHDRELLHRAAQAIDQVIAQYQEDLSVFELAASELNDLLAQQRRRVELAERRAAEAAFGRERLAKARLEAAQALVGCAREYRLTAPVRQFLSEHWQHHMVQILLRDGSDSARHVGAMKLGHALVEIDVGAASGQDAHIADRLIQLIPLLRDCLGSSGLESAAADDAVARLVRALAWPDVPRSILEPVPTETLEASEAESATLRLVGKHERMHAGPDATAAMRRLSQGDWLRLIDDDGFERALKIAWVSPLTSRFLIVNRRGMRELVATADQLALLAQQGRLVVGLPDAPFEGAMKQVRKHLQRAA